MDFDITIDEERRLVKEGIAEFRAGNYSKWNPEEVKQLGRQLLQERPIGMQESPKSEKRR